MSDAIENLVGDIWESVLGRRPEPQSAFFHDGGSSLHLMQFQLEFHRRRGTFIDFDRLQPPFPFPEIVAAARATVAVAERDGLADDRRWQGRETA